MKNVHLISVLVFLFAGVPAGGIRIPGTDE
jgi:hypothetical protein